MAHLPQTKLFLEKSLIWFSRVSQNFKRSLEIRGCTIISVPKWLNYPNQVKLTISPSFMYLLPPLNMLKKLEWIQNCEITSFSGPKWSTCPITFFFWKTININFTYILAPFIMQKFNLELWWCAIFRPK